MVEELELGSMASIRAFADRILAREVKIDYLINNAGVASCPFARTLDGFEMQFGVNHLGHFLMTNLIAPALADGGRVVALSSTGHRASPVVFDDINFENRPYEKHGAYGQSKTANALFAVGLNARLSSRGIEAFSVQPGAVQTELNRHMTEEDLALFEMFLGSTSPTCAANIVRQNAKFNIMIQSGMFWRQIRLVMPIIKSYIKIRQQGTCLTTKQSSTAAKIGKQNKEGEILVVSLRNIGINEMKKTYVGKRRLASFLPTLKKMSDI